jgi:hypothetical protein
LTPSARTQRFSAIATALGALVSLMSAFSMRDHVRLVEIVTLFFGGVGTGAGIASHLKERARATELAE